jgi:hypothetical protein
VFPRVRGAVFTVSFRDACGSSKVDRFGLRSEIGICYVRQDFSCGQLLRGVLGIAPEEHVDNFWIACLLSVFSVGPRVRNRRTLFLEKA